MFGDLGNDWIVGGPGPYRLFGGMGDDLLNADDNLDTNGGLDVLIANTGFDRLIDWRGEFNSYFVPFSSFGEPTVVREPSPHIQQFLLDLGRASGADQSLTEPNGELGLVTNHDPEWGEQLGMARDPQPGTGSGPFDNAGGSEDDTDKIPTIHASTPGGRPDFDGGGDSANNGVGNGEDPQRPGDPPINDGDGTEPGDPGICPG